MDTVISVDETVSAETPADLARALLKDTYLSDGRPWVVAYSGGKDSTLVLQLVYEMLLELGDDAKKPVHVISSDTRVEAPTVVQYVEEVHRAITHDALRRGLPVTCHMVRPDVEETFWAKLIGKGYPPPTRWFRWCTTNMKIKPSKREIEKIAAVHGSVILLLGSRSAESSNRSRSMAARQKNQRELNSHHEIPNAFVLAPIATWEDDDVWEYLYENNPPPWGRPHDQMLTLYRRALGGECPVVMDLNTPSCGGSRFGCWTCTVVKLDKSMEGFIATGEEWMRPMAEFRNWLKEFRENPDVRLKRRRDGSDGLGPFNHEARLEVLRRLFEVERKVEIQLISDEEVRYVQNIWSKEFDLTNAAIKMANEFGRGLEGDLGMPLEDDEIVLLEDLAAERGLNPDLVEKILSLEGEFSNLGRWGARADLRRKLSELVSVASARGDAPE